jgi:hypothetical protein
MYIKPRTKKVVEPEPEVETFFERNRMERIRQTKLDLPVEEPDCTGIELEVDEIFGEQPEENTSELQVGQTFITIDDELEDEIPDADDEIGAEDLIDEEENGQQSVSAN